MTRSSVAAMLDNPKLTHVSFDLSWSETAKYIVATPETTKVVADLIAKHPDRFLFATDEVAPTDQDETCASIAGTSRCGRSASSSERGTTCSCSTRRAGAFAVGRPTS